jgi:hypothetical protein
VIISVDFDGTVVRQDRSYGDTTTPLRLMPLAREGLRALKAAGHQLILSSARANLALRLDPELDPLVRAGKKTVRRADWEAAQPTHAARYAQMLAFVTKHLPDSFDAIDDGTCGKLVADIYIDDRATRFGVGLSGMDWPAVVRRYGSLLRPMALHG